MTETREEFRDRIRSIMISAALASDFPDNTGGQLADAAEAVAAQVLRDIAVLLVSEADDDDNVWMPWVDIDEFAKERGINLSE